MAFKDRTGEEFVSNQGYKIKIVEYYNYENMVVEFENGYKTKSAYDSFKNGTIKNPYHPTVFGVGYLGVGEYKPNKNNQKNPVYNTWKDMLQRCCDEKFKKKHNTYKEVSVSEEFKNFQNFNKWFVDNTWHDDFKTLDKDILIKGNKIYSPSTCVLVNQKINLLFIRNDKNRGKYPIGISKENNKFVAKCGDGEGNRVYLGKYNTQEEAFEAYKKGKENIIKKVAEEYKEKYPNFPNKLYEAMINYKVEITD